MQLNDVCKSMLAGEQGRARQWAVEHQLQVGRMFDAEDMVAVTQAHMMADPESLGEPGVALFEDFAELPASDRQLRVPLITDPRGVDLNCYRPLGQTEAMADLERRFIAAADTLGILLTNTCINYQTIMPPAPGEHVAFGDTGVVIYSNSVCAARSNFEGGPSALAAALTGYTPRYGLHLQESRKATRRFLVDFMPENLTQWGVLGAVIGRQCGSYWEVPLIEGIKRSPTPDELKHFGAAMASYGSTPLFHMLGVTPESFAVEDILPTENKELPSTTVTCEDCLQLQAPFVEEGAKVDVVVFAAPQLSLIEMQQVASLCSGRQLHASTDMYVCTSSAVYADASSAGFVDSIESFGAKVLQGTCFYQQYAAEIREANGWSTLLSNSTKIVNILGGYGYQPLLASMQECVDAAVSGRCST